MPIHPRGPVFAQRHQDSPVVISGQISRTQPPGGPVGDERPSPPCSSTKTENDKTDLYRRCEPHQRRVRITQMGEQVVREPGTRRRMSV